MTHTCLFEVLRRPRAYAVSTGMMMRRRVVVVVVVVVVVH